MAHVDPYQALQDAKSNLVRPGSSSHKGQNGRLLMIAGTKLFHAPMIWAASAASRIVDHVHVSSTTENNEVFVQLKSKFTDGIAIERKDILSYVDEDDCILIGPGMPRGDVSDKVKDAEMHFNEIIYLEQEHDLTYALVRHFLKEYPRKNYVLDAGALQNMDKEWLLNLEVPPILTPHIREFDRLFGVDLTVKDENERQQILVHTARKYRCVILLKNVTDYITDGSRFVKITGGNAGLAKGGSGDILAGLAAAFYTKSDPVDSLILASYIVKTTAEDLAEERGLMYNSTDLVENFGKTAHKILG